MSGPHYLDLIKFWIKKILQITIQAFLRGKKNYVDLSMDLRPMGYPDKYSTVSYETETFTTQSGFICPLMDIADAVHIPLLEFILPAIPNPVVLRPGGENKN